MEELLKEAVEALDIFYKMKGRQQVLDFQHWFRNWKPRAMKAAVDKENLPVGEPFRDRRNPPEGTPGSDGAPAVPTQSARAKRKGGCCGGRDST